MVTKQNQIGILVIMVILYFLLKYIVPYGDIVIYPISLFVTFMHEFGHAIGALFTGGEVVELQVNSDGSGLATTVGGWSVIILMGGYIGSAILGNILLYFGMRGNTGTHRDNRSCEVILYSISALLSVVGILWYSSFVSFVILVLLAAALALIAYKTDYDAIILQFLGIASILYIIEDFNVGPTSDLQKFSEIFVIIPQGLWMIIWLILVIIITLATLRFTYKSSKK